MKPNQPTHSPSLAKEYAALRDHADQTEVLATFTPQAGDRVTYVAQHGIMERGIVKSVRADGLVAWVVYACAGNWDRYQDYTGCATDVSDLRKGWY